MKRFLTLALSAIMLITLISACSGPNQKDLDALYEELMKKNPEEITLDSNTAVKAVRNLVWESYKEAERKDPERVAEITQKAITYGEATMHFDLKIVGKAGADGYPLIIALHGGGGGSKEVNDQQWDHMKIYYLDSVTNGLYVATRGVRDTWDTHFNPESYPLYERLIDDLSIYYGIDTNRVYLVGYSAGGDGVYQITPRLADRFAAANMSAGHPNGVNLTNLYNVPFQIQCGQNDSSYNRNTMDAYYCEVLDKLHDTYNGGYIHNVNIHLLREHGIIDNDPNMSEQGVMANPVQWYYGEMPVPTSVNSNSIYFVEQFKRNPVPERVVWDLSVRADEVSTESFYWLRASTDIRSGVIVANYDKSTNTVTIEQNTVEGEVKIMLNDEMVDLFKPVKVVVNGKTTEYTVTPTLEYIKKTVEERCDPNMIFAAEITIE